ncbi:MAG: ribonuclease Z [Oligoflexia bacterium]|nr:ribonuclease Z [Oligoflexia bacterium]
MKLQVIGSGEAFDGEKVNSSFLLSGEKTKLLIDCGFTVPHALWRMNIRDIDGVYITHFHGDHVMGLPALITRMFEEQRKEPLIIIGQTGARDYVINILDSAYRGIYSKLCYELLFYEKTANHRFNEFDMQFTNTTHSVSNQAVCVTSNNKTICFSGDGAPTEKLIKLYTRHPNSIVIQECFTLKKDSPYHCSLDEILEIRNGRDINFILTHLSRHEKNEIKLAAGRNNIKVCEDGEIIFV